MSEVRDKSLCICEEVEEEIMADFFLKKSAEDYKKMMQRLGYKITTSARVKRLKSGGRIPIFTVRMQR